MKNFLKGLYTKLNMKTVKKYKLTDECITIDEHKLYRIKALKDFSCVKKGDKGGFVESEDNLSQGGNCWICGDAKVFGNAVVCDNAMIFGDAMVYSGAVIMSNAKVFGNAKVYSYAKVLGSASISGSAQVYDNVEVYVNPAIYDNAIVYSHVVVSGNAVVFGNAKIWNNVRVSDNARVYGDARIFNTVVIRDNAKVFDNAEVCNNILVWGEAEIGGDAKVTKCSDYIVFKNWWSSGRYFTWTRSNNMCRVGCCYGTGEELIEKGYKDSEISGREYKRGVKYVESILKDNK